jgi:hypothetical protein
MFREMVIKMAVMKALEDLDSKKEGDRIVQSWGDKLLININRIDHGRETETTITIWERIDFEKDADAAMKYLKQMTQKGKGGEQE